MNLVVNWVISGLAIMITGYLLPGVTLTGFKAALLAALVLGLVNAFIKPVLTILTLPLTIMTLGLFSLVINALLIMLTSRFVSGFHVDGFWWAVVFSLVLALVNWILGSFRPTE